MITNELLEEIIRCPKIICRVEPKKPRIENRNMRRTFYLTSQDGKYNFNVFERQSTEFLEDFSYGLVWTNANEHIGVNQNLILFRCQGPHDGRRPIGTDVHHSYHTHVLSSDDIIQKRYRKPSERNDSDKFTTFSQASFYFFQLCGIINIEEYFESESQMTLYE